MDQLQYFQKYNEFSSLIQGNSPAGDVLTLNGEFSFDFDGIKIKKERDSNQIYLIYPPIHFTLGGLKKQIKEIKMESILLEEEGKSPQEMTSDQALQYLNNLPSPNTQFILVAKYHPYLKWTKCDTFNRSKREAIRQWVYELGNQQNKEIIHITFMSRIRKFYELHILGKRMSQIKHDHLERYDLLTRHLLRDLAKIVTSYL